MLELIGFIVVLVIAIKLNKKDEFIEYHPWWD